MLLEHVQHGTICSQANIEALADRHDVTCALRLTLSAVGDRWDGVGGVNPNGKLPGGFCWDVAAESKAGSAADAVASGNECACLIEQMPLCSEMCGLGL